MAANDRIPPTASLPSPADLAPATRPPSHESEPESPPTRVVSGLHEETPAGTANWTRPPDAPLNYHTTLPEDMPPTSGPPLPTIPGYEILVEIGRGGMGVVYKARQTQLKRVVALKMLLTREASGSERARFRAEAEAVARLQHPNIVQIYEVGEWEGQPYFSLEYIEGGSLDQRIRGRPQPPRDSAELMRTLALAVEAAHDKQIIHRDLKPANVLLNVLLASGVASRPEAGVPREKTRGAPASGQGATPLASLVPKITDFGLARRLDADVRQTSPGSVMGTPPYMAPEQARGRVDEIGPWTDVYALGAILYELLTGRPPFTGQSSWEILEQVREEEPLPPRRLQPHCPRDLEIICLKCLHKKARSRYRSARDLADDLDRWLEHRPILARPTGSAERAIKWVRRSPLQAAALAAGAGFLAMLLIVLSLRVNAARTETALLRQQEEANQRQLEEQQRHADVRTRFEALFARAGKLATQAPAQDTTTWNEVAATARTALALVANDPAFAAFALRDPVERLLQRAEGELGTARERDEVRARLARLKQHHGDAVFFATLFSGLELTASFERVRTAARAGLALFGVTPDDEAALAIDRRFFDEAEVSFIVGRCYELLLLDAEVLSQGRPGEKVTEWRQRLRQALMRIERADRLGPRTHAGLLRRADCLEKLGEDEAARRTRADAAGVPPTTAADFFLTGLDRYRDHARGGDAKLLQEAARLFSSALRQQPGHYGALYLLAVCRVREERWQEARVNLTACLDQRPDFLWPLLLRGFAAMKMNEPAEAEADFDAVLKKPPDPMARYVAHVNRAVLLERLQRWDRARMDLEKAIAINPDAHAAYLNLAMVHRKQGELPAWQESLLLLGPAPVSAVSAAALGQRRRMQWSRAVADLDRGIERRKDVSVLHHERARLHLLLGDSKKAREDLTRAIALAPVVTTTLMKDLLELGRLMQQSKEHARALVAFEAILELRPDEALVHLLRSESLLALFRHAEAGAALDQYLASPLSRRPSSEERRTQSDAFKARGLLHAKAGEDRAAIASYTQGLQLRQDADVLALRGWAYLVCGAPGLALTDFDEALALRSGDADALVGRADAQVKLGKVREALADVEEARRRGLSTRRLLYNAARVHAQAAVRLRDATVDQTQRRAAELLGEALALVPEPQQPGFWRDYVEKDHVFAPLLRLPAMIRLREQVHAR